MLWEEENNGGWKLGNQYLRVMGKYIGLDPEFDSVTRTQSIQMEQFSPTCTPNGSYLGDLWGICCVGLQMEELLGRSHPPPYMNGRAGVPKLSGPMGTFRTLFVCLL